jgi:PRC-barrel domain
MSERAEFVIGSTVECSDGPCGELRRVVVDPLAHTLTHLVVEPKHRQRSGHLVPIDLVDSSGTDLRLRCTLAEFDALEAAEETQFLGGAPGQWPYGQADMMSWPYYGLELEGVKMSMTSAGAVEAGPPVTTVDRIPVGDVEVRRGEPVHAADGAIGHVQGLVIDRADHQVTHVLLAEGHLWGHKTVAIPISAVGDIHDGVHIELTKDQVRDLPAIEVDRRE